MRVELDFEIKFGSWEYRNNILEKNMANEITNEQAWLLWLGLLHIVGYIEYKIRSTSILIVVCVNGTLEGCKVCTLNKYTWQS